MDDFKIGILGAGNIARSMAKTAALMPGVTPYAVAAREPARAEAFAKEHGVERAYASYEALAQDEAIDLVYIATPHSHHAAQALMCIEAGRPVLVEKAFTGNARQARQVLEASKARKVFATEAMWTRFLPMMGILKEVVDSGAIGKPVMLSASFGTFGRDIPRMREPALAGGALLDLGVYPLTLAALMLGPDPVEVTGEAVLLDTGVDASHNITLKYAGGAVAAIQDSMLCGFSERWQLCGEAGRLEVDGIYNPTRARLYDTRWNLLREIERPEQLTGYEYEVAASMKAIREGRLECPEIPHAETLRMMELMDGLRAGWGVKFPFD